VALGHPGVPAVFTCLKNYFIIKISAIMPPTRPSDEEMRYLRRVNFLEDTALKQFLDWVAQGGGIISDFDSIPMSILGERRGS
jgi:hypothetical protein